MVKDFLDQELRPGDDVVFIQHYKTSSCFLTAKVERLTDRTVVFTSGRRKDPDKIIKIHQKMYLLKVKHRYDETYEPIGLFTSVEAMEGATAEYLQQRSDLKENYEFTWEEYEVDKLI